MEEAERRLSAERTVLKESQETAQAAVNEAQEAINTLEAGAEQKDADIRHLKTQVETSEAVAKQALSGKREAEQQLDSTKARLEERISGLDQRLTDAIEARQAAEKREAAAHATVTARDCGTCLQLSTSRYFQRRCDRKSPLLSSSFHIEQELYKNSLNAVVKSLNKSLGSSSDCSSYRINVCGKLYKIVQRLARALFAPR